MTEDRTKAVVIEPGSFEPVSHFYPRVLNAQIHPLVRHFLSLGNERISKRYCHLRPERHPNGPRAPADGRFFVRTRKSW